MIAIRVEFKFLLLLSFCTDFSSSQRPFLITTPIFSIINFSLYSWLFFPASHLNSSFNTQMPLPVSESLVKVQICRSIERNTTESLWGSLEPNSSKISCVVAWPATEHCNAMKFLISTSKLSLSFPRQSALASLLGTRLFRALILASNWLEWTDSESPAAALLMPIRSPLKWGWLSATEEICKKAGALKFRKQ